MRRLFRFVILALSVCSATVSFATGPRRELSQYQHETWGSERGFPGGAISCIAQTTDGYLWIGTDRGLVRFDGLTFHLYQSGGPGLPIGPVQQLSADNQGNLWILLKTTQVLRYRDGRFEAGHGEAQFGITAIGRRQNGSLLLSSDAFGPLTYADGNYTALATPDNSSAANTGVVQRADTLSSHLSWATGVTPHRFVEPDSPVVSVAETTDGKLWLGTRGTGLFYISPGRPLAEAKNLLKIAVNCLLPLQNGELWIGTDHGILRWDGNELTSNALAQTLRDQTILTMIRDRDSNIWIGTANGLIRINPEGALDQSPEAKSITVLLEDREGNIWIGTHLGLERLRDDTFLTYSAGSESQSGGPVYVDETNRTWFAPFDGGLRWIKNDQSGAIRNDELDHDVIYSLSGGDHDLWIGRQQGGLTHLVYDGGSLHTKTYRQADGLAQDSVFAVHEARDGTVWAGTLSAGVSALANGTFKTYSTTNGMSSNFVTSIAEGADNNMWFGTSNGLDEFADHQWHIFKVREGLPSSEVTCLMVDSSGTLWIGTKSGMAFLRSGIIHVPADLPSTLREQTLGIAEDKFGWLWIATSTHVLRVNRARLMADVLDQSAVREYGVEDGLRGTEGVNRFPSVVADPQGNIWFSTNRGISVVDPRRALRGSASVIVHIEGVSVDGTPVNPNETAMLSEKPRRLTITYTGLSLSVPDRVQFKYKLENVDDRWSEPVRERQMTYNNLASGSYRFVVQASDSQGVWNSGESAFQFRIAPAYWETWWFRVSVVGLGALCIFLFYRLRMQAFAQQMNVRFEERLAERTRIAQELHDTLLQGFLSASMQLHVIADQLPADSPTQPALQRVLGLIGRVIDEGRNAVRGLRTSDYDSLDFGEAFSRIKSEFPDQDAVAFRVVVEGTPKALHPMIRDEIYRIGHEALTNAFRHAGAERIEAELEYGAEGLRLVVRDNGNGFNPHSLEKKSENHWGLTGMRERAKRIGATFRVLSREAAGTEVDLWVPSHIAFQSPARNRGTSRFASLFRSRKSEHEKPLAEQKQ
ncbi:MAG TPA: two-component regulator propeller domain-containing protein [Verrucomicrobiae bacterium]|nr:two-component regulator propeller domain-containing protein [Verrucomicrobiae bacterium]